MLLVETPLDPEDTFLQQGSAMFTALVDDFVAAGHHVVAPLDSRVVAMELPRLSGQWDVPRALFQPEIISSGLQTTLVNLASSADLIVLIAPECDQILTTCYQWLAEYRDKWLGGPSKWIKMASDKNALQSFLATNNIPVPNPNFNPSEPWVAKPTDGAGSEDILVFDSPERLDEFRGRYSWRVERFVPGEPVSVSVVRTKAGLTFLPPTGQSFAGGLGSAIGAYTGARYPLEKSLADRAKALAVQTVEVLPAFLGYIGIDMILATDGPDVVVEINPRMTMSYCHLPVDLRRKWILPGNLMASSE